MPSFLGDIIGNAISSSVSKKIGEFTNKNNNNNNNKNGDNNRQPSPNSQQNRQQAYDPYGPPPQQQMYNNNNNNSGGGGYPGYPPQQQPGGYGGAGGPGGYGTGSQGGYGGPGGPGGYPQQYPQGGYPGGGPSGGYAPNVGFDVSPGYPPASSAPYPGGHQAPYPDGGNSGGLGFTPSQPSYGQNAPANAPYPGAGPQPGFGSGYGSQQGAGGYGGQHGGGSHGGQQGGGGYGGQPGGGYGGQPGGGYGGLPSGGGYGGQPGGQSQPPHNNNQSPFHGPQSAAIAMAASRPTLYANQHFNANASAEMLRKAMKGFGCDKQKVVQSLCTISNWQRQEVARAFKGMYGKDLIAELRGELSGDFEDLILALMEPPAVYDARQLHDAMAGFGTKESVLIEIMTTRTNAQIQVVKQTYQQLYRRQLESDLIGDTSGHFQRLLVSLCAASRDESGQVDQLKANQDARALYRAGEQRLGTDESTFNAILASQNHAQLRAVFDEYAKASGGHSIEQALHAEFSGDVLAGLLAIVKCVRCRPAYFAELLNNSMKGIGTRDADLIRLVVSRAEIDLADIRDAYQRQYNQPLDKAIAGDCSGAYKDGLIALVKGN